jgi:hypothetical protein
MKESYDHREAIRVGKDKTGGWCQVGRLPLVFRYYPRLTHLRCRLTVRCLAFPHRKSLMSIRYPFVGGGAGPAAARAKSVFSNRRASSQALLRLAFDRYDSRGLGVVRVKDLPYLLRAVGADAACLVDPGQSVEQTLVSSYAVPPQLRLSSASAPPHALAHTADYLEHFLQAGMVEVIAGMGLCGR